jgi:hypothetical protein
MKRRPEERATASLVHYSKCLHQVILVGDCQAENGKLAQHFQRDRYVDTVASQARAVFRQTELLDSKSSDSMVILVVT